MSYQNYLPSKKFVTRVLILMLITGGVFIIYLGGKKFLYFISSKTNNEVEATPQIVVKDLVTFDRDNDGLKDWEEKLWQMDPEKPDTNNDGVLDGVEVAKERADLALKNKAIGEEANSILLGEENETEQFLRELLLTVASVGQAGEVTKEGADAITAPALDKIKNLQLSTPYTIDKIKTGTKTTATRLEAYNYSLKVDALLNKYPLTKDVSLLIIKKTFDTNDRSYLDRLSPIQENYKNLINGMLAITVPKPFAQNHLRLINAFLSMKDGSIALQKVYENPIKALASLMQYSKFTDELKDAFEAYIATLTPYEQGTLGN